MQVVQTCRIPASEYLSLPFVMIFNQNENFWLTTNGRTTDWRQTMCALEPLAEVNLQKQMGMTFNISNIPLKWTFASQRVRQ